MKYAVYFALILALSQAIFGQQAAQFFPLVDIKEGMRGTARTVFRGTEPEEFGVEILGVIPGAVGPQQDLIIGRLSGKNVERTGVFAGMSGSPVFIDGKLAGAISYSFPFSKEPICGITPIEQMISIFEQNPGTRRKAAEPRVVSFAELASTTWQPEFPKGGFIAGPVVSGVSPNSLLSAVAGQAFQPISTPLAFGGFSQETLNMFSPQLMASGLLPVSTVGGAASITGLKKSDEKTLLPGSSVAFHVTRGDYSLAAAGTVTFRNGKAVYAFGHPFLSIGVSDLGMAESEVVAVIPSIANSFKLAVPKSLVGTMTQDRATGVLGKLGQAPSMIPLRINFETSRGQTKTLNYEIAKDDFLTPFLLNLTILNTLIANEGLGNSTIELDGEIRIKGQDAVRLERRFTGMQAVQATAAGVAIPANALMRSRFEGLEFSEIVLKLSVHDGTRTASLERIAVDKSKARPGETIAIQAFVRADSGKIFLSNIPLKIPADTPLGVMSVVIGDGNSLQQAATLQSFVPKNLADLIRTMNKTRYPDKLYAQISRTTIGAVIGVSEMPNLPPSVLATLNNDRSAGSYKPSVQTVVIEDEIAPAPFIISGQQTLVIEIIK